MTSTARGAPEPAGSAGLAVDAAGIVKRFGKVTAVDGVDLRVGRGHVYGLLGPTEPGRRR